MTDFPIKTVPALSKGNMWGYFDYFMTGAVTIAGCLGMFMLAEWGALNLDRALMYRTPMMIYFPKQYLDRGLPFTWVVAGFAGSGAAMAMLVKLLEWTCLAVGCGRRTWAIVMSAVVGVLVLLLGTLVGVAWFTASTDTPALIVRLSIVTLGMVWLFLALWLACLIHAAVVGPRRQALIASDVPRWKTGMHAASTVAMTQVVLLNLLGGVLPYACLYATNKMHFHAQWLWTVVWGGAKFGHVSQALWPAAMAMVAGFVYGLYGRSLETLTRRQRWGRVAILVGIGVLVTLAVAAWLGYPDYFLGDPHQVK